MRGYSQRQLLAFTKRGGPLLRLVCGLNGYNRPLRRMLDQLIADPHVSLWCVDSPFPLGAKGTEDIQDYGDHQVMVLKVTKDKSIFIAPKTKMDEALSALLQAEYLLRKRQEVEDSLEVDVGIRQITDCIGKLWRAKASV